MRHVMLHVTRRVTMYSRERGLTRTSRLVQPYHPTTNTQLSPCLSFSLDSFTQHTSQYKVNHLLILIYILELC